MVQLTQVHRKERLGFGIGKGTDGTVVVAIHTVGQLDESIVEPAGIGNLFPCPRHPLLEEVELGAVGVLLGVGARRGGSRAGAQLMKGNENGVDAKEGSKAVEEVGALGRGELGRVEGWE